MGRHHNGESLGAPLPSPQLWFVPPAVPQAEPVGLRHSWLSDQERVWGEDLPPLRRGLYCRSRAAMRRLLGEVLDLAPRQVPLHSPPGEPPRLNHGHGSVSLSHARGALLIGWAPRPIGVDLEPQDRRFEAGALMQRFFPPAEQLQLAPLTAEPLRRAVLRSWLAKEAAIKWRQRSIAVELAAWDFDHQQGLLRHRHDGTVLQPREGAVEGWCWAAVAGAPDLALPAPLTWRFDCG